MASSVVLVEENGQGRYQQRVASGHHELIADEPVSMGGDAAGPAPFDYLMAGLGACTSMTLRMYAERKGLQLTRVRVELAHDKIEGENGQRDRITRKITLDGQLSDAERQRLLEIAGKCPVHRALSQSMQLDCELDL